MPAKPVQPAEPDQPEECPTAQQGAVAEVEQKEEEHTPSETDTSWIEIEMFDEAGAPVAGMRFKVKLSTGRFARGTLDENGFARLEGLPPGPCDVTFPLDENAWEIQ